MTREADNPMTESDFDWMVSNHAVWGWKALAKASVRRFSSFSPSALSLFRFDLSPFPPETPDTQAIFSKAWVTKREISSERELLRKSRRVTLLNRPR